MYRDSPVSVFFWSPANRTIGKTALIEHWFSAKIAIWDFWIFKVPFFSHFHYWNLTRFFLFWTEFSETKLKWKSNGSCLYKLKRNIIYFWKNVWRKLKQRWFFFENLKKKLKIWKKKMKTLWNNRTKSGISNYTNWNRTNRGIHVLIQFCLIKPFFISI